MAAAIMANDYDYEKRRCSMTIKMRKRMEKKEEPKLTGNNDEKNKHSMAFLFTLMKIYNLRASSPISAAINIAEKSSFPVSIFHLVSAV